MVSNEHLNKFAENLIDMEENLEVDKLDRYINPQEIEMCIISSLCHRIHLYHLERLLRVNLKKANSPFDSYITHFIGYLKNKDNPSRDLVRYEISELIENTSFNIDHIESEFLRNFTQVNFEVINRDLREDTNINMNIHNFNSEHILKKLKSYPININMKLIFLVCSLIATYRRPPATEISQIIGNNRYEEMFYDFFDSTVSDIIDDSNANSLNLMYYLKAILMIFP